MSPSGDTLRAASEAIESYRIFNLMGKRLPSDGGTDDQEAEWVEQIDCVAAADEELQRIAQQEEEEKQKAQAQHAKMQANKKR